MKVCIENVGLMCHPETMESVSFGRIASVRTRSKVLRPYGFVLNENPDGSNSS